MKRKARPTGLVYFAALFGILLASGGAVALDRAHPSLAAILQFAVLAAVTLLALNWNNRRKQRRRRAASARIKI